jgi:hypothetical protein
MKTLDVEQIAQLLAGTARAMATVIEALTQGDVKARVEVHGYIRNARAQADETLAGVPARLLDAALTPPVQRENTLEQLARRALASAHREKE